MARRHRIIFLAALSLSACSNKKEVESAKRSLYDTEFAVVFSAALSATRDLYPTINDAPGPGKISTAWHQVSYANNQDDLGNQRTLAQQQGVTPGASTSQQMAGVPTRLAYKRYFIRFDVQVIGGRPWRVKVIGHASEWEPGNALPTEMKGAQRPAWLDGRTEALQVAIYRRIKNFAVPMKDEAEPVVGATEEVKTDPKAFSGVPGGAAKRLAALKDTLAKREFAALRVQLDDNVVWSLGGGTGADVAIATWQADPSVLDSMAAAIAAGCAQGAVQKVACPAGPPSQNVYQVVLEARGDSWLVTSFVKGE